MKNICFVILSRANYGSIKSVIEEFKNDKKFKTSIVVGASSIVDKYGSVSKQIRKDGFKIDYYIESSVEETTPSAMVKTVGMILIQLPTILNKIKPDLVFTVGDRYETISTAIAASYMNIPVAHTMGGEITGTIDELVRHSITKLSHIHFAATALSKKNIILLGEDKKNVFNVGCPRLDLIKKYKINKNKLFKEINKEGVGVSIKPNDKFLIVMQHPVTTEYENNYDYMKQTLDAIREIKCKKIIMWPNADAGSDDISKLIRSYREKNLLSDCRFIKNLKAETYIELLKYCSCIIGNSSSAIREGSFVGVPGVNVGSRQNSREKAKNIITVKNSKNLILNAIKKQIKKRKYNSSKLYGDGKAGKRILKIVKNIKNLSHQKTLNY